MLAKLAPGLAKVISGPVSLDIQIDEKDQHTVSADFGKASISLALDRLVEGAGYRCEGDVFGFNQGRCHRHR